MTNEKISRLKTYERCSKKIKKINPENPSGFMESLITGLQGGTATTSDNATEKIKNEENKDRDSTLVRPLGTRGNKILVLIDSQDSLNTDFWKRLVHVYYFWIFIKILINANQPPKIDLWISQRSQRFHPQGKLLLFFFFSLSLFISKEILLKGRGQSCFLNVLNK